MYPSTEYKNFKATVSKLAMVAEVSAPTDGNVRVSVTYHPKGRKVETDRPLKRMDCDAHLKPVLDSLIGIAYHDDYQVIEASSRIGKPTPYPHEGHLVIAWESV